MARIGRTPDVAVGERWAYRARLGEPLAEVAVLRLGVNAPRRVLVRWADDAYEGLQDWVPPARLKAPWAEVEAFREHERRWDEAVALANAYPEPVHDAVGTVFDLLVDERVAMLGWNAEGGIVRVRDLAGLLAFLDESPDVVAHDAAFVDAGELVLPMPVVVWIARRAAARDPDAVLRHVEREKADAPMCGAGTPWSTSETILDGTPTCSWSRSRPDPSDLARGSGAVTRAGEHQSRAKWKSRNGSPSG